MKSIELIKAERERQINEEGYTPEHDDNEPTSFALSSAALVYACDQNRRHFVRAFWPWDMKYFKPDTTDTIDGRIKELVKAGALIAAEIDRLHRLQEKK